MAGILRQAAALALFAALTAAGIGLVELATHERAADTRRAAEQRALLALLPEAPDGTLRLEQRQAPADVDLPGWTQPQRAFVALRGAEAIGVILPASARGYGGAIRLLVGLDSEGRITGLRVLSHRETPGLGDLIEPARSDWLAQFQDQSLERTPAARWAVRDEQGEFDRLTGATITSRAAIAALRHTLEYFAAHRTELLGTATEDADEG